MSSSFDNVHVARGTVQRIKNFFEVETQSCSNLHKQKSTLAPGGLDFNKEELISFPRSSLMEMATHYRKLCEQTGERELFICTDILKVAPSPCYNPEPLTLDEVRALQGNEICADCGSPDTSWASTNIGVFLCIRCSGVHRSLGVHVSTILSCTLDIWPPDLVKKMETLGNQRVNEEYEYHIQQNNQIPLRGVKLSPNSSMQERQVFIKAKYISKEFHRSCKEPNGLLKYSAKRAKLISTRVLSTSQTTLRTESRLPVTMSCKDGSDRGMVQYCGIVFIYVHTLIKGKKALEKSLRLKKGTNSIISTSYVSFRLGDQIQCHKEFSGVLMNGSSLKLNLPMDNKELLITLHRKSRLKQEAAEVSRVVVDLGKDKFNDGAAYHCIHFPNTKTALEFSVTIEQLS